MAITTPAKYGVVAAEDLLGRVDAGIEPVRTILENANWLYANHRPALVNLCSGQDAVPAGDSTMSYPVIPSADALTYEVYVRYYVDTTNDLGWQVATSPDHATWSNVVNRTITTLDAPALATGDNVLDAADTFTIPAATRYLRFFMSPAAAGKVQIQSVVVLPAATAPTAGVKASGFIAFDRAALVTGGAIHTELFNRCRDNRIYVLRDRYQAVASYVTQQVRLDTLTFAQQHHYIAYWPYTLRGQQNPTVTVRVHATGSGAENLYVRQVGVAGNQAGPFACDTTHRTGTMTLKGEEGALVLVVDKGAGGNVSTQYATVDWRPGD